MFSIPWYQGLSSPCFLLAHVQTFIYFLTWFTQNANLYTETKMFILLGPVLLLLTMSQILNSDYTVFCFTLFPLFCYVEYNFSLPFKGSFLNFQVLVFWGCLYIYTWSLTQDYVFFFFLSSITLPYRTQKANVAWCLRAQSMEHDYLGWNNGSDPYMMCDTVEIT